MWVGMLGEIPFVVSSEYLKTVKDVNREYSANYEEIKVIEGKPLLVFTGENLDTISLQIQLLSAFNVNPTKSVERLERYMKNGNKLRFILGLKIIGSAVTPERINNFFKKSFLSNEAKDFFGISQVVRNKSTGYWCITSISEKQNFYSVIGTPISITVTLNLKEYN